MDSDAEFNALASMYQSVMHDMKVMYPAWENVSQKALKLAAQLKSTLSCMSAFVDSIQAVGDAANNLKGSTRDMGACLTRVCIRQRSIESRLRSLADALTDELALSLQTKGSHWKQRVSLLDRHASKFTRKLSFQMRSRKTGVAPPEVANYRTMCFSLLEEQRSQLSFFISALLPVLNNELSVLEESGHVRQVTEHLQSTVCSVDSSALIEGMLVDVHQGSDYSWRSCLSTNAANRSSYAGGMTDEVSVRAPSPSPTTFTWPTSVPGEQVSAGSAVRAHTISVVEQPRRGKLNHQTFSPPSPSQPLPHTKPPLPKRNPSGSSTVSSMLPSDFVEAQQDQSMIACQRNGSTYSSTTDVNRGEGSTLRRPSRPLSFACDDRALYTSPQCRSAPSTSHMNSMQNSTTSNTMTSSEYRANSLIAETIEQIDKLGSELDSYCKSAQATPVAHEPVRLRCGYFSGSCKPAPPERRNSSITAATANAPSVADVRASCEYASSSRGSSQDLNRDTYTSRYF